MKNLGLIFYKDYFKNLKFNQSENGDFVKTLDERRTHDLIEELFNTNLTCYNPPVIDMVNECFELTTIYPGILIGSGYNHEIGEQKNELKLGFFFDHTTGLPCIPGSSVKGVLRDACEKDGGKYFLSILEELGNGERPSEVEDDANKFFNGNTKKAGLKKFVQYVFEGKQDKDNYLALKERDIFFDAFPIKSENPGNKFLANDYITHHENPFKNPNPVQFMKVLPQVTFRFNFRLSNNCMPPKIKLELFRQILLDLGCGAKTNVGYGHFKE